jgi:transcriptional regulator with XRE-family HTH domain
MRADRIIQAREWLDLGQRECAEQAGLSATCLCLVEKGQRNPTAATVKALCEVLGVSADWLLGLSDDPITVPPAEVLADRARLRDALRAIHSATTAVLMDGAALRPGLAAVQLLGPEPPAGTAGEETG